MSKSKSKSEIDEEKLKRSWMEIDSKIQNQLDENFGELIPCDQIDNGWDQDKYYTIVCAKSVHLYLIPQDLRNVEKELNQKLELKHFYLYNSTTEEHLSPAIIKTEKKVYAVCPVDITKARSSDVESKYQTFKQIYSDHKPTILSPIVEHFAFKRPDSEMESFEFIYKSPFLLVCGDWRPAVYNIHCKKLTELLNLDESWFKSKLVAGDHNSKFHAAFQLYLAHLTAQNNDEQATKVPIN